jgi:hypothetical protein
MHQITPDELEDMKDAHIEIKNFLVNLKNKYSFEVVAGATLMNFVEFIYSKSRDKEHFLSYSDHFKCLLERDADIFFG